MDKKIISAVIVTAVIVAAVMYGVLGTKREVPVTPETQRDAITPGPSVATDTLFLMYRDGEPILALGDTAYLINRERLPAAYVIATSSEDGTLAFGKKTPIMGTPPNSVVWGFYASEDRNLLVFVILSGTKFYTPTSEFHSFEPRYVTVWAYDVKLRDLSLLLQDHEIEGARLLLPFSVSPNYKLVAFTAVPCDGCGFCFADTLLYNFYKKHSPIKERIRKLGDITDFGWVGDNGFRYKKNIFDETQPDGMCGVYKDSATIPFEYDLWD